MMAQSAAALYQEAGYTHAADPRAETKRAASVREKSVMDQKAGML
jgi:hypothetical protein